MASFQMPPAPQTSRYLGPLPLELFICIIALSVSHVGPIAALIRLEQLRLVRKSWLAAIDSTPQFWTTIPNNYKAAPRIEEWIKKSDEAPLRVKSLDLLVPVEPFLSLLRPVAHRWKQVEIQNSYWVASAYLNRPAPLLEELILSGASFEQDSNLCAGVTPSLTRVELFRVKVPWNLSFLKSLKYLRLHSVTYKTQTLSIDQIYEVLTACPDLRRLSLTLEFNKDTRLRTPITFPNLESLWIHSSLEQIGLTSHLLSIIDAPNLINMSTDFDRSQALQLFASWLARRSLHQTAQYDVAIEPTCLVVFSPHDEQARLVVSATSFDDSGIQVLEEIDKSGISSSPLSLTIGNTHCIPAFVGYLMQPKVDKDGVDRWPLPTLRSVCFNRCMDPTTCDRISGFAQVRKDIARITIGLPVIGESGEKWREWDASSMSFVPFKAEQ
ncbi:hypothetical protein FRC01_005898 [Tulasnella sp. 417]|nr:hypothetical protein FRC01_005898 [Tulasnella sp. 417]